MFAAMATTTAVSIMTTSPNAMISAFSPYTDSPSSPAHHSGAARKSPGFQYVHSRCTKSLTKSLHRHANAGDRKKHLSAPASAPAPAVVISVPHASPPVGIDIVDPSPIAPSSNGTEFTDMDEDETEKNPEPPRPAVKQSLKPRSPPSATLPALRVCHQFCSRTMTEDLIMWY